MLTLGTLAHLVVFIGSHPLRPLVWGRTAGFSPGAICVVRSMPLKGPQLLESYLPDRPIAEEAIDKPIVAVDADTVHLICARRIPRTSFRWRGLIGFERPGVDPPATGEYGNKVCIFFGGPTPVPGSALGIQVRPAPAIRPVSGPFGCIDIEYPAVEAVAADIIARFPGGIRPVTTGDTSTSRFRGLRTKPHFFRETPCGGSHGFPPEFARTHVVA